VEVENAQSGKEQGDGSKVKVTNRGVVKEVKVYLDFSYVRKDRRCRVYVMEDFVTAQVGFKKKQTNKQKSAEYNK
jgi:hypothetical protein